MAGLRGFIIGLALVIVFTFACFNFLTSFLYLNNPSAELFNEPSVNQSIVQLESATNSFQNASAGAQKLMSEAKLSPLYIFLIFEESFKIPISFLAFIFQGLFAVGNIIFVQVIGMGLGGLALVFNVILAALTITAVFLIIRAIRSGETER